VIVAAADFHAMRETYSTFMAHPRQMELINRSGSRPKNFLAGGIKARQATRVALAHFGDRE
jgi:hypothetical protein